jgi:Flp pilus assembly protein TadD
MTLRAVVEPVLVGLKRRRLVFDALSLLRPFDLPEERKVHIGTPGDGSYVMVDRLRASQPVMSFGVGPSVEFETEMAERGHSVFLFDHTIDSLPATHPRFTWFREGITGGQRPEKGLFTLAEHMDKLPSGSQPIFKIDVEGAEWAVLDEVSTDLLTRFEQIALEAHFLYRFEEPLFNARVQRGLRKLASHFTLCHVHANNFSPIRIVGGFPLPEALELTYIRSDLVRRTPSTTLYPTSIDRPNFPQFPDHLLWFFPFLPGSEAVQPPAEDAGDRPASEIMSHAIELNARGLAAQEREELEEALAFYDRALILDPDLVEVLYNRGNALSELRRFDEALESYGRALAIRPDHVSTLNNRGRAFERLMCFEEALACYDQVLIFDPNHANAIKNRASVLQKLQRATA